MITIPKQPFQTALLTWYDHSKRILPWRDNPNPYHVWISEIMLQQTRVETVIPFFHRFIEACPTIADLAQIDDDKLNKLWEGLGYYSRARNLKKAAKMITDKFDSEIPTNQLDLESLPGIGSYTSGAILSIAFNQKYTAVDGNVLRVFARLTANTSNIKDPQTKKAIRSVVEELLPSKRVGDFNQALMEIGATVCKPNGAPDCIRCPLIQFCEGQQKNLLDIIPMKQVKATRRKEQRTVFVIKYNNQYLLEQRPEKGLLAGLYQFPNVEHHLSLEDVTLMFPNAKTVQKIASSKHIFSHIEWNMIGYFIEMNQPLETYVYSTIQEMESVYSIPTAFQTYKRLIIGGLL